MEIIFEEDDLEPLVKDLPAARPSEANNAEPERAEPARWQDAPADEEGSFVPHAGRQVRLPAAPKAKRKPQRVSAASLDELLAQRREDGTMVVRDSDSCADPDILREAAEKKRALSGRKPKERPPILERAVGLLSRREHSKRELRQKLLRGLQPGETAEMVEEALAKLESRGYLSDERYAQLKSAFAAPRLGNARIARELRAKGVSDELVRGAIESIAEPEEVRAYRVWQRRYDEIAKDRKERDRQIRYLLYRGFSMSAVMAVVRGDVHPDEENV